MENTFRIMNFMRNIIENNLREQDLSPQKIFKFPSNFVCITIGSFLVFCQFKWLALAFGHGRTIAFVPSIFKEIASTLQVEV
jgi:hypothetical protein